MFQDPHCRGDARGDKFGSLHLNLVIGVVEMQNSFEGSGHLLFVHNDENKLGADVVCLGFVKHGRKFFTRNAEAANLSLPAFMNSFQNRLNCSQVYSSVADKVDVFIISYAFCYLGAVVGVYTCMVISHELNLNLKSSNQHKCIIDK